MIVRQQSNVYYINCYSFCDYRHVHELLALKADSSKVSVMRDELNKKVSMKQLGEHMVLKVDEKPFQEAVSAIMKDMGRKVDYETNSAHLEGITKALATKCDNKVFEESLSRIDELMTSIPDSTTVEEEFR